jgi:hypothetical protein
MLSVAHDGAAAVGIVPAQQVAPHWWALAGTD